MVEKYRICLITPPNYIHASCFLEVAMLLKSSLDDLGIDCDLAPNQLAPDRVNIILGSHLIQFGAYLREFRYIPFQLEQLSAGEGPFSENLQLILQNAYHVWDYSLENCAFLKTRGITATHVPIGYHRNLEQVPQKSRKEVDILFYGSAGPRRQAILDKLAGNPTLSIKHLFGVYGKERDSWIGRSHLVLNVHHYTAKIFEAVRISYLLNNQVPIISEESSVNPYPEVTMTLVPYDALVATCEGLLKNRKDLEERAIRGYEQFRTHYEMTRLLQDIV